MESRLTEIEVKLSYHEESLEELNRTIYRQQQQIDRLRKDLQSLGEQLRACLSAQSTPPRETPPHY